MRAKKTMDVEQLKSWTNEQLKRTDDYADQKFKAGLCSVLAHVLHATGNYHGFNYTYWLETGNDLWRKDGEPDFPEKNKYIGNEYDRVYY